MSGKDRNSRKHAKRPRDPSAGCANKISFATEEEALKFGKLYGEHPHLCRKCNKYHLRSAPHKKNS